MQKIPEHQCHVELFAGDTASFFMRKQALKVEVINDLNGDLINLYRVVQHHLEEFIRQFKWALVSRQMFDWLKKANADVMNEFSPYYDPTFSKKVQITKNHIGWSAWEIHQWIESKLASR